MKAKFFAVFLLAVLSMSSCYVNRTTVGAGPVGKHSSKELYGKTKQVYLFWGAIGLGQAQPPTPQNDYMVKTSFNFWDQLVMSITGGIVGLRTVKVYVKPDGQAKAPTK